MAEYRQIHTHTWKDTWFLGLTPKEKLMFIYLFSNERVSLSGIYEVPLPVICFETGLAEDEVTNTLEKFQKDGKVYYDRAESGIWIVNLPRYQGTTSYKLAPKIKADIDRVPECEVKTRFLHTVSIPYRQLSVDPNPNPNPITESESAAGAVNVFSEYQNNIGLITPVIADRLKDAERDYPGQWIKRAIEIAVERNARRWNYIDAILKRWATDGYDGDKHGNNGHVSAAVRQAAEVY
jgi:DnaD/phage-associated family protein